VKTIIDQFVVFFCVSCNVMPHAYVVVAGILAVGPFISVVSFSGMGLLKGWQKT